MASAVHRVFSTPELLELILIHLPLPCLLQAQLISCHVNTLIRTSPRLRQLLFQWPEQPKPDWRLNPLLSHHFPPFFFIDKYDIDTGTSKSSFRFMDWTLSQFSRSVFLRRGASWRNMLVVQPPPRTLLVSRGIYHADPETGSRNYYDGTYDEPGEEVATLAFENGVTMGRIYDLVIDFMMKDAGGVFNLRFESRPDGVQMVLRLYSVISDDADEDEPDGELYESEGREIGVDDLEWKQVKQDRLNNEYRLSEISRTWGCDLTWEKGGTTEQDWHKKEHQARIREFMARQSARGRGE